jgi:hypothetical protein
VALNRSVYVRPRLERTRPSNNTERADNQSGGKGE